MSDRPPEAQPGAARLARRERGVGLNLELLPALLVLACAGLGAALPAWGPGLLAHLPTWLSPPGDPLFSAARRLSLFGGALATLFAWLWFLWSGRRVPLRAHGSQRTAQELLAGTAAARLAPDGNRRILVYSAPREAARSFGRRNRAVIRLSREHPDERLVELCHELAHLDASHPRKKLTAMLQAAWLVLLVSVLLEPAVSSFFERDLRREQLLETFRLLFDMYLIPIALVLAWPLTDWLRNQFHAQEFSADLALKDLTGLLPELKRAQELVLQQVHGQRLFPFDSHPSSDDRLEVVRGGAGTDSSRYLGAVHSFAAIVVALSLGLVGLLANLLLVRVLAVDRSVDEVNERVRLIQSELTGRSRELRSVLDRVQRRTEQVERQLGLGELPPPSEAGSFALVSRGLGVAQRRLELFNPQLEQLGREVGLEGDGSAPAGLRLVRDQLFDLQPNLELYGQSLGLLPARDGRPGLLPSLNQRLTTLSGAEGPLAGVERALGSYLDERGPYALLAGRTQAFAESVERARANLGLPDAGTAAAPGLATALAADGGTPYQRLEVALTGAAESLEGLQQELGPKGAAGAGTACPDWRKLHGDPLEAEIRKLSIKERLACVESISAELLLETIKRAQQQAAPPGAGADGGTR